MNRGGTLCEAVRPEGRWLRLSRCCQWLLLLGMHLVLLFVVVGVHLQPDSRALKQLSGQYQLVSRSARDRGAIYDSAGDPVALSVPTASVFLDPGVEGWEKDKLKDLLPLVGEKERALLEKGDLTKRFYWLKRYGTPEEAEALQQAGGKGVFSRLERKRVYPKGSILSHLLGFTDSDGVGLSGIELKWNDVLYVPERLKVNYRGTSSFLYRESQTQSSEQGVYLTVDSEVQYAMERFLGPAAEQAHAGWAAAVCLESSTGAVLGMASWPAFDPNDRATFGDPLRLKNNAINQVYEPGSTFKPIMVALAMDRGLINGKSSFRCPAYLRIADAVMKDSHPKDNGTLTVTQILEKSSNVGMAQIGMKMDPYVTYNEMRSLGLGQKTGITLGGEEEGLIKPPERWLGVTPANVAIGQGFAVTPLQLTGAFNAIVNNGVMLRPYLVRRAVDVQGEEAMSQQTTELNRALSSATARWVRGALRSVVEHGTAKVVDTPLTKVAAKTGTAQVARQGKYVKGIYNASMIGFWPADKPEYTLLVVFGDVQGSSYYGGQVAGPVFKDIVEEITRLRGADQS